MALAIDHEWLAEPDLKRIQAARTIGDFDALVAEAERRMSLSNDALRTHGHQGITWRLATVDAAFLAAAREERQFFLDIQPPAESEGRAHDAAFGE